MMSEKGFSEWFKENTPKEGLSENTTFTRQFLIDAWDNGYINGYKDANEWRFVKDGLPKTSDRYLVYTGGEPFILDFDTEANSFGYWVVSLGSHWGVQDEDFETVKDRGEDEVIAWKEIVLPELSKEN